MTLRKVPVLDNTTNLVDSSNLGTGTADNTTFLRGDSTWQPLSNSVLHTVKDILDFGPGNYGPEYDSVKKTITGQTWVTSGSILQASVSLESTLDHDIDDIWVEELQAYVGNIVPGVGFDVVLRAPNNTWGKYVVVIRGN